MKLARVFVALVALAPLPALDYVLPKTSLVVVTGTEVKRMDAPQEGKSPAPVPTRDVRFIMTADPETGVARVFRNEDAGLWPPYFKFDSADLAAEAAMLARKDAGEPVAVTHYGWRIHLLDMFPNATSIRQDGSAGIPPMRIAGFGAYGIMAGGIAALLWQRRRRKAQEETERLARKAAAEKARRDEQASFGVADVEENG